VFNPQGNRAKNSFPSILYATSMLCVRSIFPTVLLGLPLFLALTSCTASDYTERADKDVYGLLGSANQFALGEDSTGFSIDTSNSDFAPLDLSSNDILKDRSASVKVELTIDKALSLAIDSSRTYQDAKEDLYLAALTLSGERHQFRPQLYAQADVTHSWLPGAGLLSDSTERTGGVRANAGFNQALLTGGSIGVNIANDLLRFFTGDSRRSAVSAITANISQPLLRGAGQDIAAERLTQAHRDLIYAVRDFSHFQNTFSNDIVVQYFRLLQQKDTLYNQYANYQSRVDTTAYLRARAVDRAKPLDVSSAEQDELSAKNSYIAAVVSFSNAADQFKIALGLPTSTQLVLDDSELEKLRKAGPLPLFLDPSEGFAIALENRLPLINAVDQFEDAQRQVAVAADALKPGLNLFANAALASGGGPVDYLNFSSRDLTGNIGVSLDLPLNKTIERNNLRATEIQFENAARSLGLTFDQLRNRIDQSIRQLSQFRQSYIINKNALALALKRVEGARLQLQAGSALFRDLQDAQDALIGTQNDVTAALVNYLEVRLGLLTDLGILETRKSFWLEADASLVDLSQAPPGTLPNAFLSGDEIIPPDQLFSQ
jgi:outer membrane protein TolC